VPNQVLADHPLSYWRLGDPAGSSAASDASGANPGAYSGVTLEAAGAVPGDPAASFAGAGAVTIPASTALDLTSAVSVEAWVKPSAAGQNGGIFEKTIGGSVNTQYLLFLEGGAIKFRGKPAASGYVTASGPALAVGSWSHVVATFDGATLRLYVNGAPAASAAASTLASGSGVALIGTLGSGIYAFSGQLDEVAVYAGALPAARVLAHYTDAATRVTTARVTIDVRPNAGGTLTSTAQLNAAEPDPNGGDNVLSFSINVN